MGESYMTEQAFFSCSSKIEKIIFKVRVKHYALKRISESTKPNLIGVKPSTLNYLKPEKFADSGEWGEYFNWFVNLKMTILLVGTVQDYNRQKVCSRIH